MEFQFGLVPGLFLSYSSAAAAQVYETWVGSSAVDMTPPIGVPLAGYGGSKRRLPYSIWGRYRWATFLRPSTGVQDPIRSKAFLIKKDGRALLFLSLDTIGVDYPLYLSIKEHANGLGIDDVFVSATHTHSGPGTLSKSLVLQIMATDRFQPEVYRFVEDSAKWSIELALRDLKPARLFRTSFRVDGLQSGRPDREEHLDPEAHLLYAQDNDGKIRGGLINFAVPPTALGEENLKFSADLAGGIENALKSVFNTHSEFLFMNGAEADLSPRANGIAEVAIHSAVFAQAAKAALGAPTRVLPKWRTRSMSLTLPGIPRTAEIKQLVLDDVLMVTWPGEATTEVGAASKAQGTAAGFKETWNLGLTNGYNGAFIPKIARFLLDAHRKLFEGTSRSVPS